MNTTELIRIERRINTTCKHIQSHNKRGLWWNKNNHRQGGCTLSFSSLFSVGADKKYAMEQHVKTPKRIATESGYAS